MSDYIIQLTLGFEELYSKNRSVIFYRKIFEELDLSHIEEFPKKRTHTNAGRTPFSKHALFRAFIVMKCQRLTEVSELMDYLENNIAVALLCGFGFKLPKRDVFYRFIKKFSHAFISTTIFNSVSKLIERDVISLSNLAIDSTPIFSSVKHNNPKSFAKNKFAKSNQPKSDKDCKLGVYTASNDSSNKKTSFFWGYKNHIITDAKSGLPIFNLTTPANCYEPFAAVNLLNTADVLYCFRNKLKYLIADKGYDTTDFHQFIKSSFNATAIIPLKSNAKAALYDGNVPFCEAGLKMHKEGHLYSKTSIRFKFVCPFRKNKTCPCPISHHNSLKTTKTKGCIKWLHIKNATQRNSIDRNSAFFKHLYKQRTSIERYNARFKYLKTEKPLVKNLDSIQNLNSFAHLALLLVACASAKSNNLNLIRSLAELKKIA